MDQQEKITDDESIHDLFNVQEEIEKTLNENGSKKKDTDQKYVTLGLDIGTQYCYAGYIYKGEFKNFLPNAKDTAGYGVPSEIAYMHNAGTDKYLYGIAATNKINEQTRGSVSIREANDGKGYYLWQESIKTLIRKKKESYLVLDNDRASKEFKVIDNLKGFLSHFFTYAELNDDIIIDKIVLAYPNVEESGDHYQNIIKRALNDVIVSLKGGKEKYFEIQSANDGTKFIDIQIKSEGSLAVNAIVKKFGKLNVGDSFMTVDVGGGTIDYAYLQVNSENNGAEHKVAPISKVDWAIKEQIDDKLLGDWLVYPTPENKTNLKKWYFSKNDRKGLAEIQYKDAEGKLQSCQEECNACQIHDNIMDTSTVNLTKIMNGAIDELLRLQLNPLPQPKNVCLLGGGSHMIFIQNALKVALQELYGEKYQMKLYTITKTNRKEKDYSAIYQGDDKITTANFLAYAAALFGEQQRMSGEKNKSTEAGSGGGQNESAVVYPGEWISIPVSEVDTATYVFEVNPTDTLKRYIMLPERKYNNQDAYILVPTPIVIKQNGQNIYNNIKILLREEVASNRSGEYIEVSESDLQGLSCQNIGPETIPDGKAFAVGIKFSNNYLDSDDKKLQIYLYQAVLHDKEHVVLPNNGEKPYFAEGELTEERKRQLGADYDFELTFKEFMDRSGQNLKC